MDKHTENSQVENTQDGCYHSNEEPPVEKVVVKQGLTLAEALAIDLNDLDGLEPLEANESANVTIDKNLLRHEFSKIQKTNKPSELPKVSWKNAMQELESKIAMQESESEIKRAKLTHKAANKTIDKSDFAYGAIVAFGKLIANEKDPAKKFLFETIYTLLNP